MSGIPLFFRRAAARARRNGNAGRLVLKGLSDGLFPFTYFLQNVMMLQKESGFARLSPRLRRGRIQKMLRERAFIFLEVKRDLGKMTYGWTGCRDIPEETSAPPEESGYCIHCGGCCEIASGLDGFPPESAMPPRWRRLFCNGLGKGHRFCPFLWEDAKKGRSLCPVHPWRSNACRIFEREECEYFLSDPDYLQLANPGNLIVAGQLLARLIDG